MKQNKLAHYKFYKSACWQILNYVNMCHNIMYYQAKYRLNLNWNQNWIAISQSNGVEHLAITTIRMFNQKSEMKINCWDFLYIFIELSDLLIWEEFHRIFWAVFDNLCQGIFELSCGTGSVWRKKKESHFENWFLIYYIKNNGVGHVEN